MFRRTRPNLIESDEGFSIEEFPGKAGKLIYREGERKVGVSAEMLVGDARYMLYPYEIKTWDSPHENEPIDRDRLEQIIENIRRAYRYFGQEIRIFEWDLAYHGPWTEEDFDYFRKKGFKVYKLPDKKNTD